VERAHRIAELWSWLPAFRVVAETQHLPTAAKALHVSPSALSRSVSLLEEAIGEPLFTRRQRRLHLNARGDTMLAAVRDAMRRIDDGLHASTMSTRIRVAGQAAWIALLVVPVMADVELEDVHVARNDVRVALLRGEIDLAIVDSVPDSSGLHVESLGAVSRGLCYRVREDIVHAVCSDGTDPWPADQARRIGFRSPRLDLVADACVERGMSAVLPTAIARSRTLRVSRRHRIAPSQLHLVHRPPLGPSTFDALVAAVRSQAQRVLDAGAALTKS
jgi:DNA-binding transcriptional LysR family regulator